MKLDLFEKLIRKIIREEIEFYNSKLINEIKQTTNLQPSNGKMITTEQKNHLITTDNIAPSQRLASLKAQLAEQYGESSESDTMSFGNAEIPEELKGVFNRDYSELMKRLK